MTATVLRWALECLGKRKSVVLATVIQTSASIASDYISIEKLKTFITGSYAEFQTAIGSL